MVGPIEFILLIWFGDYLITRIGWLIVEAYDIADGFKLETDLWCEIMYLTLWFVMLPMLVFGISMEIYEDYMGWSKNEQN